ncbi:MAG: SDR family oxidoreductase [Oxalobacteraceae bacterium]|nr:MAG: SDR family oxidoreductase [Oxalobacteraceae bacterium]
MIGEVVGHVTEEAEQCPPLRRDLPFSRRQCRCDGENLDTQHVKRIENERGGGAPSVHQQRPDLGPINFGHHILQPQRVEDSKAALAWPAEASALGGTGLYLASDASKFMTGQVLYVDGGYQILGM